MGCAAQERIDTAIRLGKPDRVPVVPMLDIFAARYAGVSQHDMLFDVRKGDAALEKVHRELGPIDGFGMSNSGLARMMQALSVVPPVLPGLDGADANSLWQFNEKTVMSPDEYAELSRDPAAFIYGKALEHNPNINGKVSYWRYSALAYLAFAKIALSARRWRRKGVEPIVAGNNILFPIEYMTMVLRSVADFLPDLFRHPDEVRAASRAMMRSDRGKWLLGPRLSGIKRACIGLTRTSATFLSPRQFEKFALHDLRELSDYLIAHGVTPVLHMDNDWTPLFRFFTDWPRGKCIANLDGNSDIVEAKRMLGDVMCIMGDIPATLLKLGEPDEVRDYCRRLIDEVGAGGGFILSSGCDVPIDARPENVKAMIQSVHDHGRYR